jgi:uncharacterized membrane protein
MKTKAYLQKFILVLAVILAVFVLWLVLAIIAVKDIQHEFEATHPPTPCPIF